MDELRAAGQHHRAPEEAINTAIFDFDLAMDSDLRNAKIDALGSRSEDEVMARRVRMLGLQCRHNLISKSGFGGFLEMVGIVVLQSLRA